MIENSDLLVGAWSGDLLVGVARCKVILLAAPAASAYYPHLGYKMHPDCWILARDSKLALKDRAGE